MPSDGRASHPCRIVAQVPIRPLRPHDLAVLLYYLADRPLPPHGS